MHKGASCQLSSRRDSSCLRMLRAFRGCLTDKERNQQQTLIVDLGAWAGPGTVRWIGPEGASQRQDENTPRAASTDSLPVNCHAGACAASAVRGACRDMVLRCFSAAAACPPFTGMLAPVVCVHVLCTSSHTAACVRITGRYESTQHVPPHGSGYRGRPSIAQRPKGNKRYNWGN